MDFAIARRNMVDSQILPNRVVDTRIIDAMSEIPREAFVAANQAGIAYVDEALALGDGRYMMEPMIVARLLETAQLSSNDTVLCIGCGSGYASAIIARIVTVVVAVECDKSQAQKASNILVELGIDNVAVIDGVLSEGMADQGPYDVIFFDGAVSHVPEIIIQQLSDGGRLVAMVSAAGGALGFAGAQGSAQLITRHGDAFSRQCIFDAGTPILPGFESEKPFVF